MQPRSSTVVCVDCQQNFPPAQVDLSPNGMRCQNCKLRHDIDVHSGADEQIGEISTEAMRQKAANAQLRGIGAIVGSILGLAIVVSGGLGHGRGATRLFLLCLGGVGWGIYELASWRRAKRAVQIAEARNLGAPPTL
ncbi:MAG TPA: hypothetical protein VGM39_15095 [Kofleriaceae bacterium]